MEWWMTAAVGTLLLALTPSSVLFLKSWTSLFLFPPNSSFAHVLRTHLQDLKEVTHNIHYETYRAKRLNDNGGLPPVTVETEENHESNLWKIPREQMQSAVSELYSMVPPFSMIQIQASLWSMWNILSVHTGKEPETWPSTLPKYSHPSLFFFLRKHIQNFVFCTADSSLPLSQVPRSNHTSCLQEIIEGILDVVGYLKSYGMPSREKWDHCKDVVNIMVATGCNTLGVHFTGLEVTRLLCSCNRWFVS